MAQTHTHTHTLRDSRELKFRIWQCHAQSLSVNKMQLSRNRRFDVNRLEVKLTFERLEVDNRQRFHFYNKHGAYYVSYYCTINSSYFSNN